MSAPWPRVQPIGDQGLLVEYPPEISREVSAMVLGADAPVRALPGVVETVPTLRSLLAVYDPLSVTFETLAERTESCARAAPPAEAGTGRMLEVPVVYGGPHGPDLEAVADTCGLTPAEVVRLHSATVYTVFMLGFAPGFPYLGLLPPQLRVGRRMTPRLRVPAGSVAIADALCGIYPQETAGGWHLLGRTRMRPFNPDREPACLLRPGDRVRFVPVPDQANAEEASDSQAGRPSPRRPVLEVLHPGLLTTIQDLGRPGWRRYGIPFSGALDPTACATANAVLGNDAGAAVLEVAFPGPRLRVLRTTEVACAGADFGARVQGALIDLEDPVRVRAGDIVEFAAPRLGQWGYLAVTGGIDVPAVFGSRATFARGGLGGFHGRPLRAGDILGQGEGASGVRGARKHRETPSGTDPIRIILGPQTDSFTVEAQAALLSQRFEVTLQRDRSGMRLRGARLGHRRSAEIVSDGMLPGVVQVPGEGQPIVILADGPTTGGYARIGTVITADLDRLAQMPSGAAIQFRAVSLAAAHEALISRAEYLVRIIGR